MCVCMCECVSHKAGNGKRRTDPNGGGGKRRLTECMWQEGRRGCHGRGDNWPARVRSGVEGKQWGRGKKKKNAQNNVTKKVIISCANSKQ